MIENYFEDVQMEKLAARIAPTQAAVLNWLPNRYFKIFLQEQVIRPYVMDSWPFKSSAKDFCPLLAGKKLLSCSRRALRFWIIFKGVIGKFLTKPVRIFRKLRGRRLLSSPS